MRGRAWAFLLSATATATSLCATSQVSAQCPSPSASGAAAGQPSAQAAAPEAPEAPKTPNQIAAETHYKRGRELYALGRYREAIAQLEAALRLDPTGAELLFNLGLVHEKLGEADEAIDAYNRYLKALGRDVDVEEKKKIQAAIRRLEGAKAELRAREARKTEHRFTPLSIGLLVGAGLSAVATVILGVSATSNDRQARDFVVGSAGTFDQRNTLISKSKTEAVWADVFGIASALALGGALTLYFTSSFPKGDNPSATTARLGVSPTYGGGAVRLEVLF